MSSLIVDPKDFAEVTAEARAGLSANFEAGTPEKSEAIYSKWAKQVDVPFITDAGNSNSFRLVSPVDGSVLGYREKTVEATPGITMKLAREAHALKTSGIPLMSTRQNQLRYFLENYWPNLVEAGAFATTALTGKLYNKEALAEVKGKGEAYFGWGVHPEIGAFAESIIRGEHIHQERFQIADKTGLPISGDALKAKLAEGKEFLSVWKFPSTDKVVQSPFKAPYKGVGVMGGWGPTNYPVPLGILEIVGGDLAANAVLLKLATATADTMGLVGRYKQASDLEFLQKYRNDHKLSGSDIEKVAYNGLQMLTSRGPNANTDWYELTDYHRAVTSEGVGKAMDAKRRASQLLQNDFFKAKTTLELAGLNAVYVHKDMTSEELKKIAEYTCLARVRSSSGRICTRAGLVFVHEDVADEFYGYLEEAYKNAELNAATEIGNPYKDDVTLKQGAMFNPAENKAFDDHLDAVKSEGVPVIGGAHVHKDSGGLYRSPSWAKWPNSKRDAFVNMMREGEIFAPATSTLTVSGPDDFIKIANALGPDSLCLSDCANAHDPAVRAQIFDTLIAGASLNFDEPDLEDPKGPGDYCIHQLHGHGANAPGGIIANGSGTIHNLALFFNAPHHMPELSVRVHSSVAEPFFYQIEYGI